MLCGDAKPWPRFDGSEGRSGDVFGFREIRREKGDLVERVEVEVFLRRDVGAVRAIETGGDEEELVLVGFQQFDDFGGDFPVGLFVVGAFGARNERELPRPRFGV